MLAHLVAPNVQPLRRPRQLLASSSNGFRSAERAPIARPATTLLGQFVGVFRGDARRREVRSALH